MSMTMRTTWVLAAGVVLAATTVAARPPQAGGTITGTVKVAGQASNADVVVYVVSVAGAKPAAAPAVMDQKNMKFVPHVLAVPVGTTVKFTNSDTVAHNVFSPDHDKYNLGTFGPGLSKDHVFTKCATFPCAYVQLCMIHPEMEGYVVVVPNSYFATSNDAGQFTIQGVPAGQYQVGVWYAKAKAQPKPVTVEAGKPATVDFALAK
jgi:plastocyanin